MRKIIVAICIALGLSGSVFAEIKGINFAPQEFADDTYVIKYSSADMDLLEVGDLSSQSYDYAFRSKDGRFELRYILFKQTDVIPEDEYKMQASLWATMVIANITGTEPNTSNTSAYNDADVKKEFNADFGINSFSNNILTDYSEDYEYVMIAFYCKKDLGIMCQTIHFNDLTWTQTDEFLFWFHGFNFY